MEIHTVEPLSEVVPEVHVALTTSEMRTPLYNVVLEKLNVIVVYVNYYNNIIIIINELIR